MLANEIGITYFHTFQRQQSDSSPSLKLQNNFTLFNGTFYTENVSAIVLSH